MYMKDPLPAPATAPSSRRMIIVGGGASGVLLAAQVLRREPSTLSVTIIERREMLGCGVAYSTSNASHLLNTRVSSMSAFPNEADHFLDWLRENHDPDVDRFGFVTRSVYGKYLTGLLDPWRGGGRLSCVHEDCVRLDEPSGGGVVAHLSNGATIPAAVAVLATGHALPDPSSERLLSQPWAEAPEGTPAGRVLIVGSGLTMVDQVMSLLDAGFSDEIVAVSRRGLLPQPHEPSVPATIRQEELPLGFGAAETMRWLRRRVAGHVARGGNWRDVVDGLRPHMQTLWRGLSLNERRSFLRHACTWWEVHRHRVPPESYVRLQTALRSGQLNLWRGAFRSADRDERGRVCPQIEMQDDGCGDDLPFARIIDCRGIRRDPEIHASRLISELLASGRARIDPLRLGLDIGAGCQVLRADGRASVRIFAIGPASRAAFWEITAVPDIREQAEMLAGRLSSVRL